MNLGLIIGIVAAIAIIGIGIVYGSKLLSKDTDNNQNITNKSNTETSTEKSTDGKYVIHLNDMKITLGETTMDYIVKNTDLTIIEDSTSHGTRYSSEIEEGDTREIILSDGINTIIIESYFGFPNKTKSFSTSKKTDDPNFDMSTETKVVFVDNAIGKNISIGDSFTEDEITNIYKNTGTCFKSYGLIQCSQTKLYANDFFAYWLDDNYKIVNMTANLQNG